MKRGPEDVGTAPPAAKPGGGWAALMWHELEVPGRALASPDPGYRVYCVGRDAFREQLRALAAADLRGASLGVARARAEASTVAITFDDGCATDWLEAAPALRERGFGATFYVLSGFLGRPGYLALADLRALAEAGFEIGSHARTHRMLTALSAAELDEELAGSRARLEDAAGVPVRHLSCPHGRWSRRVAEAAGRAGYATVATSDVGLNRATTPGARLRRIAVQRGADAEALARLVRGEGLRRLVARDAALGAAKRLLGEAGYAALRARFMRHGVRA